jgi:uncharacterized protein (DUF362 family)
MITPPTPSDTSMLTRRQFLKACLIGGGMTVSGFSLLNWLAGPRLTAATFIGRAESYEADFATLILQGFGELGVTAAEIKGKHILLKPNLVEPHKFFSHINTHPLVIRGTVEAFLQLGAASVVIGEGPGNRHDSLLVLEESGLSDVLYEDHIPFKDLNTMGGLIFPNLGGHTTLTTLTFPRLLQEVDWIVSLAKMKTHHWSGVTLSMKNLFGMMPGNYYGWPKNVLHQVGISKSILDINATLKPHFAIVDGIIGMDTSWCPGHG